MQFKWKINFFQKKIQIGLILHLNLNEMYTFYLKQFFVIAKYFIKLKDNELFPRVVCNIVTC
jgi:hypothetical protein